MNNPEASEASEDCQLSYKFATNLETCAISNSISYPQKKSNFNRGNPTLRKHNSSNSSFSTKNNSFCYNSSSSNSPETEGKLSIPNAASYESLQFYNININYNNPSSNINTNDNTNIGYSIPGKKNLFKNIQDNTKCTILPNITSPIITKELKFSSKYNISNKSNNNINNYNNSYQICHINSFCTLPENEELINSQSHKQCPVKQAQYLTQTQANKNKIFYNKNSLEENTGNSSSSLFFPSLANKYNFENNVNINTINQINNRSRDEHKPVNNSRYYLNNNSLYELNSNFLSNSIYQSPNSFAQQLPMYQNQNQNSFYYGFDFANKIPNIPHLAQLAKKAKPHPSNDPFSILREPNVVIRSNGKTTPFEEPHNRINLENVSLKAFIIFITNLLVY